MTFSTPINWRDKRPTEPRGLREQAKRATLPPPPPKVLSDVNGYLKAPAITPPLVGVTLSWGAVPRHITLHLSGKACVALVTPRRVEKPGGWGRGKGRWGRVEKQRRGEGGEKERVGENGEAKEREWGKGERGEMAFRE